MIVAALALALAVQDATSTLTYEQIVHRLVDLDHLATPPGPGERGYQFSSWDRASAGAKPGTEAWFANGDANQFLRSDAAAGSSEHVMVDAEGPAMVTRIWSANPQGKLRFYVDGAATPTFEIAFEDLCGGAAAPFLEPLAGQRSRGWNCHVPFPFQRHLKIASDSGGFYYQVNVHRFADGTRVPSFEPKLLLSPALAEVRGLLAQADQPPVSDYLVADLAEANVTRFSRTFSTTGIRWLELKPAAKDLRRALRDVRLQLLFDGAPTPAVDAPLGDFFGTAPDFTPYRTWLLGVREDGTGYSRFPMPCAKTAELRLIHEGSQQVAISGRLLLDRTPLPTEQRFHAKWRARLQVPTQPRSDWLVLDADGPGRFVGCALYVANPVRAWWGEGDEHAFVDGEEFPSTFGTGTEDYFGYAWCWPAPFQSAFHSQSRCDGPGNRGFTAINRFQVADHIPFQRHLRFDIEVWHWVDCKIDYASMAYWYAPAAAKDRIEPLPAAADRAVRPVPEVMPKFADAIEGENLVQRARATGGKIEVQDVAGYGDGWSRDEQLWWTGGEPGDALELPFEVAVAGRYELRAQLTKARDYGIVQVAVDGAGLGAPIDLYDERVVPTGDLALGTVDLAAGPHVLRLTLAGANGRAVKSYMAGVDYLRVLAR